MSFDLLYVPIGVGTFHLESASAEFENSKALLRGIDEHVIVPDEMLLTVDKLTDYLEGRTADLVIIQNLTFANSAYTTEVIARFDCPVLLWTLREPVIDGTRLRLNSLTGAFSAANTLRACGRRFAYVFGSPSEQSVIEKITKVVSAARLRKALKSLRILQVGHTPQGFGFGRALDADMFGAFGARVESIEARELIDKAKSFDDSEIKDYLDDAESRIRGLEDIVPENVDGFARIYKAYRDHVSGSGFGALASRCWPDFFTAFGTPVCAVLGILNDLGIPCACEADSYGALSMYMASFLTRKPCFFGDPVSLDEDENTVTFWHCGMAPCSLARKDTGACAGLHCNRHIGPTLEFGCEAADKVTIFRVGREADGSFRFFIAKGSGLDKPQQFYGTSIVVKTENDSKAVVESAVSDGWEPHFVIAMGDIADEIKALADMLGIKCVDY